MTTYFSGLYPEVIPGIIITWISLNTEPDNSMFLECNGVTLTLIPGGRYQRLFDAIGNMYGGVYPQFKLPDYNGKYLRHRSPTKDLGVEESSGLKAHEHTVDGAPKLKTINASTENNVDSDNVYPTEVKVGSSSTVLSANIDLEVQPKTMYVRYYISY